MTPNVEPLRPSQRDGSTSVFCAASGHSEFVHEGDRACRSSVCDRNRFVVGAEARDPRPGPSPWHPRLLPEGFGAPVRDRFPNPSSSSLESTTMLLEAQDAVALFI